MEREFYTLVADEAELRKFREKVLAPLMPGESYFICLSGRNKKLTEAERAQYNLGRSEMMRQEFVKAARPGEGTTDTDRYLQKVFSYECNKKGLTTKSGLPYPEKCLVVYAYINPSDEFACVSDTIAFANEHVMAAVNAVRKGSKEGVTDNLYKVAGTYNHLKSCHAQNVSRRIWSDFDVDVNITDEALIEILPQLKDALRAKFDEDFCIVRTSGGMHVMVKKDAMTRFATQAKTDPVKATLTILYGFTAENNLTVDEIIHNTNGFIPMPGTYQYGKPVRML